HTAKVQHEFTARPWDELVAAVRTGPPEWMPWAWPPVDRAINTVEFFIHHEDVRRAASTWEPRPTDIGLEDDLWRRLRLGARLMARRAPAGVVLHRAADGEVRAKAGEPAVTVSGPPSELVLFVSGRQGHAKVDVDGPDDLAAQLRSAPLGL